MTNAPTHGRGVVVGVDASRHASHAADWAAAEAARRGTTLYMVHAFDFEPGSAIVGPIGDVAVDPERAAHVQVLAQTEYRIRKAHPTLPVVTELVHQSPAGALVEVSRRAALVVVGTRGRGGFAGLSLGSVSLRLAAHSHCPVVLLRSNEHEIIHSGEIVLGMEPHESQEAVKFAFEAAARAGTRVHAIHAWAPYPGHAQDYISDTDILARHAAEDIVTAIKDMREQYPQVQVKISVARGHPSAVLAAASRGARLTVVGAHRHHGPLSVGVGPVIQGLLGHAESPVAVVPLT